jgi:hypothetical protein
VGKDVVASVTRGANGRPLLLKKRLTDYFGLIFFAKILKRGLIYLIECIIINFNDKVASGKYFLFFLDFNFNDKVE